MSVKMPRLFLPTCKLSDINIYIKRHYGLYLLLLFFFLSFSVFFLFFISVLVLAFAVVCCVCRCVGGILYCRAYCAPGRHRIGQRG